MAWQADSVSADGTWEGAYVYFTDGEVHKGTWKAIGPVGNRGTITTRCGLEGTGWLDGFGEVECPECAETSNTRMLR